MARFQSLGSFRTLHSCFLIRGSILLLVVSVTLCFQFTYRIECSENTIGKIWDHISSFKENWALKLNFYLFQSSKRHIFASFGGEPAVTKLDRRVQMEGDKKKDREDKKV
jgi:hypothetical protein